ncbi:MAG TPA: hypothetical protein VJK50_03485, partial [Patescibacteria group bacterium]|nr:hypothetical protein [Patescibacteria group bacterium]
GRGALAAIGRLPSAHAAAIHADHASHIHGRIPVIQQPHGPSSPSFQLLWAAGWAHRLPPAQMIGHYLCNRQ